MRVYETVIICQITIAYTQIYVAFILGSIFTRLEQADPAYLLRREQSGNQSGWKFCREQRRSFFLKRKIRKNHSTGMRSIFFLSVGTLSLFYRHIRRKKRDKVGRSDAALGRGLSLGRSQSLASSRVCKLRKLRSRGCPERPANRPRTVVWCWTFSDR